MGNILTVHENTGIKVMSEKLDKNFVSEIDHFLGKLRQEVPELASQQQERKKYERINKLRDNIQEKSDDGDLWQGF